MTAQQKSGIREFVTMGSSIAACIGVGVLILQAGEFTGSIKQKLADHEARINDNKVAITAVSLRLDDHISCDLQRQTFAKIMKNGE